MECNSVLQDIPGQFIFGMEGHMSTMEWAQHQLYASRSMTKDFLINRQNFMGTCILYPFVMKFYLVINKIFIGKENLLGSTKTKIAHVNFLQDLW